MSEKYDEKEVRENYRKLTIELIKRKLTITTMESMTSGQIASLITDTEGASEIFKGAFVTYSNEAKKMQGVPREVIEKYGVYSNEVSFEMAKNCALKYKADIGIGVTGSTANVDKENGDSIPGKCFFSIYYKDKGHDFSLQIPEFNTRLEYKLYAAEKIYEELVKIL